MKAFSLSAISLGFLRFSEGFSFLPPPLPLLWILQDYFVRMRAGGFRLCCESGIRQKKDPPEAHETEAWGVLLRVFIYPKTVWSQGKII